MNLIGNIVSLKVPPQSIDVNIEIGQGWQDFDDQGSRIRKIDFESGANVSCMMFEAKAGRFLDWHKHDVKESGICVGECLVEYGELISAREMKITKVFTLTNGDAWEVLPGVYHKFTFKSDVSFLLTWWPKFKGEAWEASFPEKEAIEKEPDPFDYLMIGAKNIFEK